MKHTSKIVSFLLFPMLVFLIHLVASKVLNLYTTFPRLDIPFHYIGGLSIAYASTQVLSHFENESMTQR